MAITDQLNPLVVKTDIDALFVQEYENPDLGVGYASAMCPELFKVITIDNAAFIDATLEGGGGFWDVTGETTPPDQANILVRNKAIYPAVTWAKDLPISKEFFNDNMHNTYTEMIQKFASNGRSTRDKEAFGMYRDAFTGNTYLTPDGQPWISPAHVTVAGTVSNQVAGNPQIDPDQLDVAIQMLATQQSEDGVAMNLAPKALVVAPKWLRRARQIAEAELVSNTATNAPEFFVSVYGFKVYTSAYLSASQGGFGTNDNGWMVLANYHGGTRFIREDISTTLVDWMYQANRNYLYRGEYREQYGVRNYMGAVGSNGSGIA